MYGRGNDGRGQEEPTGTDASCLHLSHTDGVHRRLDVVHAVADSEGFRLKANRTPVWRRRTGCINVHIDGFRARLVVQVEQLQQFERAFGANEHKGTRA